MYIIGVLVEHPITKLDRTFSYLSNELLLKGVRVKIVFNNRNLIGYVESVKYSDLSKEELERRDGFKYLYIEEVIDQEPLLNDELSELSEIMAKSTLTPRVACLQTMLPSQLKPSTNKSTGIKYKTVVHFIKDGKTKTIKQQECLDYIKAHDNYVLKDIPYSRTILNNIEKQGFIEFNKVEVYRLEDNLVKKENHIKLTEDQKRIVEGITSKEERIALIYGVTGSGKTEVYLSLADYYINKGRNVIMLVPEISLTPMMVQVFKERFGDYVAILHSRLSSGERYDEYRKIKRQEVKIVVGARSAIFAPLENIGLIIMDEEHDASYKQENGPRYHTRNIARIRAKTHKANVVLGSATPSIESYSRALKGNYDLYTLTKRINNKPLPDVEVIDMIEEVNHSKYDLFSKPMIQRIQETIDEGNQVILLLNKRGYSHVQCKQCGKNYICPDCKISLTYHKQNNKMVCHYCGYETRIDRCNHCGSKQIKMFSYGTEKVEEMIGQLFNNASVIRYDVDTTKNKNGHEKLLKQFEKGEANILLGTQMVSKGLDFENVTFVGVLNADLSLNIPDFRSNERTFQLLCQVAGRSGRGSKKGTVMIQTYNASHFVIETTKEHDYKEFFKQEIEFRKNANYPPFTHMVSVILQSRNEQALIEDSDEIGHYLKTQLENEEVLGPTNSHIYKLNNLYRKRLLIKYINSKDVYLHLNNVIDYYVKKKGKVTIICDFDPYSQI